VTHRDVLVVDDDAATRVLLETLITRTGLSVHVAADGEEAVEALRDLEVHAIVMDLFMPRMNGTDLLSDLAVHREDLLQRVIVLSAAPEALLGETRRNYPIRCALRKPADISELIQNVLDCVIDGNERTGRVQPRI
jgi:CheY-like chemotaxis protein